MHIKGYGEHGHAKLLKRSTALSVTFGLCIKTNLNIHHEEGEQENKREKWEKGELPSVVHGCFFFPRKSGVFCSPSPSVLSAPDHCCLSPIALPLCFSSALPLSLLSRSHSATLHGLQQTAPLSFYRTYTHACTQTRTQRSSCVHVCVLEKMRTFKNNRVYMTKATESHRYPVMCMHIATDNLCC